MVDRFRRVLLFPPVYSSFGWESLDITLRTMYYSLVLLLNRLKNPLCTGKYPKKGVFLLEITSMYYGYTPPYIPTPP